MLPTATAFAVLAALPALAANANFDAERESAMLKLLQMSATVRELAVTDVDGYAPYEVECPADQTWVRPADSLSQGETQFLEKRAAVIDTAVTTLMANAGLDKPKRSPVIGVAMSGGGYRAMINTMGQAQGLQSGANGTGGWMDAVTYISGLSGGSWAAATYVANGGQKATDLNANVWDLHIDLINGPDGEKEQYYSDIASLVGPKDDKGFPTQITDIWGLAIANHVLPREYRVDTSPNFTISNLGEHVPAYAEGNLPMPIIIAAELSHASEAPTPKSAPIYEFTPYEFGTWDSSNITQGGYFSPIEYLGSNSTNGTCYKGFDQLSFITGVSATLFNSIGSITSALFNNASFPFLNSTTQNVATVPNPFQGYTGGENPDPNDTEITLVDAGETNQNLPLLPLLVPQRNVDAIIAFDSSSNTDSNWPDGSALYTTYNETKDTEFEMPAVPSPNGFINGGFNTRPTFFGCNDTDKPLVIYFPNYPYTTLTNISTFTFKQPTNLTGSQLLSSEATVTLGGAVEAWPACLACALTDRANGYTAENRSDTCAQCFSAFCWNGEDNTTTPGPYLPAIGAPAFLSTVDLNITMPEPSNTSTGTSGSTSAKPSGSTKDSGAMRAGTHVLAIAAAGAAAFFTL